MTNTFKNQSRYSRDVIREMLRINSIENGLFRTSNCLARSGKEYGIIYDICVTADHYFILSHYAIMKYTKDHRQVAVISISCNSQIGSAWDKEQPVICTYGNYLYAKDVYIGSTVNNIHVFDLNLNLIASTYDNSYIKNGNSHSGGYAEWGIAASSGYIFCCQVKNNSYFSIISPLYVTTISVYNATTLAYIGDYGTALNINYARCIDYDVDKLYIVGAVEEFGSLLSRKLNFYTTDESVVLVDSFQINLRDQIQNDTLYPGNLKHMDGTLYCRSSLNGHDLLTVNTSTHAFAYYDDVEFCDVDPSAGDYGNNAKKLICRLNDIDYGLDDINTHHQVRVHEVSDRSLYSSFYTSTLPPLSARRPTGITNDGTYIYTSDIFKTNNQIMKIDYLGNAVSAFGMYGTIAGRFQSPRWLTHHGGNLYILDEERKLVIIYTTGGEYVREFTHAYITDPAGICVGVVNEAVYIYVCNADLGGTNRIIVLTDTGSLVGSLDVSGYFLGCFSDGVNCYTLEQSLCRKFELVPSPVFSLTQTFSFPLALQIIPAAFVAENGCIDGENFWTAGRNSSGPQGWTHDGTCEYVWSAGSYINNLTTLGNHLYLLSDNYNLVGGVGQHALIICTKGVDKTEFFSYKKFSKTSLGTNNRDYEFYISVGANELITTEAQLCLNHITDMRAAIERLVAYGYIKSNTTTGLFNFTNGSADNLYYQALGNRTAYGATGGARYTWTRTPAEMKRTPTYDIDIGEIHECVNKLALGTVPAVDPLP